jgi:uncharacterized protein YfdQ (DUF2303 family)
MQTDTQENLAATLARVLPKTEVLLSVNETGRNDAAQVTFAVPAGAKLETLDFEKLLTNPRRAKGTATMSDAASFVAYVNEFRTEGSVVWCAFNPQSSSLSFTAVVDEHAPSAAGWRGHQAVYTPAMSIEWKTWTGHNGSDNTLSQVGFAEFLERNENDIASIEGYPSSLDMHKMATEFVARQEQAIKSTVRLQDGGVRLSYVADADAGTVETMKLFEKFAIGIPVFWTVAKPQVDGTPSPVPGFRIDARLKYRVRDGKVVFWYELIRADRVHQAAALDLISEIKDGIGAVPLRMGSFSGS